MSTAQALTEFSTRVPELQRAETMHQYWGDRCVNLEMFVFRFMDNFNEAYNGGYWDFNITHNNALYISLSTDKPVRLVSPLNYADETMSADAAGVVLTIFACSYALDKFPDAEEILATYDRLMDVFGDHPEASKIYRLLD
ncbi:MAG: antirestriction protein [Thalassospira sp.]|nr:antirestriction protein [Thalassospira sp.]